MNSNKIALLFVVENTLCHWFHMQTILTVYGISVEK